MRSRLAAALVAATLALTACGSSDGSDGAEKDTTKDVVSSLAATEILDKTKSAVTEADTLRAKGSGTNDGQSFDLDMTYVGSDASGSFGINGDHLQLLKVGGASYFKADDAFWRSQLGKNAETVLTVINGRWIKTNGEPDFAQLISFADKSAFIGEVLKPDSTPTKGEKKTVDGVTCQELKSKQGSLWVAVDDARPVKLVSTGAEGGTLSFTYEDAEAPKAPAASDTISSSAFG